LVAAIILSNRTTASITKSLNIFVESIRSDDYDSLKKKLSNLTLDNEVETIKHEFLKTIIKIDEIYQKLTQAHIQQNHLEMLLLHERFNPHLLYNSLAVLCVSAQRRGDTNALNILQALSSYYRSVLTDDKDVISLDTELSILSSYLDIANLISLSRFTLDIQKDEGMDSQPVLKHMLQPLVENAMKHGFAERDEGVIYIRCRTLDDNMVFEVIDDGEGMSAAAIANILSLKKHNERRSSGYSLRNLIRRLVLYCDDTYGLHIDSTIGAGTNAMIVLPIK